MGVWPTACVMFSMAPCIMMMRRLTGRLEDGKGLIVASLLSVSVALAACGRPDPVVPPAARDAPARAIAVRTSRFELVASAYIDLADDLWDGRPPPPPWRVLAACDDDACAATAAGPAFAARTAEFTRAVWPSHAAQARGAMQLAQAFLVPAEDAVVLGLSTDLGMAW